jgi:hypothetical protein
VLAEPLPGDIGGASFQDIDASAGLGVNQDGRVDEPAAQREVIDLSGVRTNFCQVSAGRDVHDGVRNVVRRC